jgi:ABC-type Na+ efflux pump permease subunit
MAIWTLARKDLRLLIRDPKAAIILLVMPFIFILVLGLSLGEGFGQKPDDRLRVSVLDLDQGYRPAQARAAVAWLTVAPGLTGFVGPALLAQANATPNFPPETWAQTVRRDLAETGDIRLELIRSRDEAERLVHSSRRAAVLVFGPRFSEQVARSSFLANGINPFFRDGVDLHTLDALVLKDPAQLMASSIIEQVAQGSLLRVVLPWMIGQAFRKVGDPEFINNLKGEMQKEKGLSWTIRSAFQFLPEGEMLLLGKGVQNALQHLFPRYDLTARTWVSLTRSQEHTLPGATTTTYQDQEGVGLLKRGAVRYQLLVPSYTVMFAFFLVLTVGWLFVGERRQGTLKRLRAAPLMRGQILGGKLVPCYLLSVGQGLFLLGAGRLVFGMSWGPEPLWLVPVVLCTSLAAMGLALLVAALARTEAQVSIYGTLLVLVLAGVSGCLMGDRALMPERMQELSLITPHAWALDAYRQLLANPDLPNAATLLQACGALTAFGAGFVGLAWWSLKLE